MGATISRFGGNIPANGLSFSPSLLSSSPAGGVLIPGAIAAFLAVFYVSLLLLLVGCSSSSSSRFLPFCSILLPVSIADLIWFSH